MFNVHPTGELIMQRDDKRQVIKALSLVTTIGLNMVATIVVGLVLGRWADNFFATAPWCTVAGIVLGMAAGFWGTYKRIMHL